MRDLPLLVSILLVAACAGGPAAAPASPATPATPASPATPATPATPASPATPATPASPATPPTPATPAATAPADQEVTAVANELMTAMIEDAPEIATFLGLPFPVHHLIMDHSVARQAERQAREDAWLARLAAVDAAAVEAPQTRVLLGLLRHQLEAGAATRVCRQELWGVSQLFGWQVQYPQLAQVQPVGDASQREAALARFSELPRYIDTEIANLREGLRLGYTAPRVNVERVLEQVDNMLATSPDGSPFAVLAARADDAADDAVFGAAVEAVVAERINPALRRYRTFLADEYLPRARTAVGVSALPGGEACYAALVRTATTLPMSPREVHETGLREMAGIHGEMREIGRRLFGLDDVPAILDRFRTDPELLFDTREEILAKAQAAYERARDEMPQWFGIQPRADVVIRPYPAFQEASAPLGQYMPPAEDGSRPGTYLINLYQPENQPRGIVEGVAFHETIPGHHLQLAIAQELQGVHPLQRYMGTGAFSEGWGLYTERLADEMGLYSSDLDRLGMLSLQAFRAGRLVVDAGIHALGWDRQRAIDYMQANTAESAQTIASEVDRYIITPGQATSYMIGTLEIRALRDMAEARLGDRFDIREFHDRVLEDGGVTLPMLRAKIERWVAGG
jgi:uncharacterized protein (DUF885 family)